MGLNDQWMQRDLKVLWHPCTQMKDHENLPLIPIKRGEGVWLEDFEGKRYLDAVSSWWVNDFWPRQPTHQPADQGSGRSAGTRDSGRLQSSTRHRVVRAPRGDDA